VARGVAWIGGLALLLGWFGLASVGAQGTAVVAIDAPEAVEVSEEPVPVDVVIRDTPRLGAFQFIVTFDPDLFEYAGSERGPFLSSTGRELFCPEPLVETGAVRLVCGSLGEEPPGPEGEGLLYTVNLTPKATGETAIGVTRVVLATIEGNAIEATTEDAVVQVRNPGSGANWMLWGPLIGVAVLLLAAVVGGAVVLSRRGSASAPAPASTDYGGSNSS